MAFYTMHKLICHLFNGLYVHKESLEATKALINANRKNRVILMPIYKSYADAFILHCVNYMNDIEHGFTFSNYEDTPRLNFNGPLIRSVGAILIRRNPKNFLSEHTEDKRLNQ